MKRVLIVLVIAGGGFLLWNNVISPRNASASESRLADLESQLDAATSQMLQAGRTAGLSGMDTTADVGAAAAEVERIEGSLKMVQKDLKTQEARDRAARLQKKIEDFKRQFGR